MITEEPVGFGAGRKSRKKPQIVRVWEFPHQSMFDIASSYTIANRTTNLALTMEISNITESRGSLTISAEVRDKEKRAVNNSKSSPSLFPINPFFFPLSFFTSHEDCGKADLSVLHPTGTWKVISLLCFLCNIQLTECTWILCRLSRVPRSRGVCPVSHLHTCLS